MDKLLKQAQDQLKELEAIKNEMHSLNEQMKRSNAADEAILSALESKLGLKYNHETKSYEKL